MWLQPPVDPVLPSCVWMTSAAEKAVDGVRRVRYAQEQNESKLFSNLTTLLPSSGGVAFHTEASDI